MLPVIRSILGHSKILVITLSFFSLLMVSAYFANRDHAYDQSVQGIETVNTRIISGPTPTPKPATRTYQWQPAVMQRPTSTPTPMQLEPTPMPAQTEQPSVDQKAFEELQQEVTPTPQNETSTSSTQVSCTFTKGVFLCQ